MAENDGWHEPCGPHGSIYHVVASHHPGPTCPKMDPSTRLRERQPCGRMGVYRVKKLAFLFLVKLYMENIFYLFLEVKNKVIHQDESKLHNIFE